MHRRMHPHWTPGVTCALLLAVTLSPFLAVESRKSNQQTDTSMKLPREFRNGGVPTRSLYKVGPVTVNVASRPMEMKVENMHGRNPLSAQLGIDLPESLDLQSRVDGISLSIRVTRAADLRIRNYQFRDSDCVDVSWKATTCVTEVLTDCLDLGKGHWYGASELREQLWPLEKVSTNMMPFVGTDSDFSDNYGPVQERMFFSSEGQGIYIEEDIPLFVSINATGDKKLCLQAKYDEYWYSSGGVNLPELNYTVCMAQDARSIHQLLSDRYIQKPEGTPNPLLFHTPIWATWAKYKVNITQAKFPYLEGFSTPSARSVPGSTYHAEGFDVSNKGDTSYNLVLSLETEVMWTI
ncbi:uncharacterized protein LOC124266982 [Haliotis rubra]|uniref:uncharacterized protein LOC124266982 n=1 Tax=Haliotis rubra TaxID=36100 RepID=UPI001EE5F7F6|nr:uncharacterized protein LOC124266982 [Haliotis rubra]